MSFIIRKLSLVCLLPVLAGCAQLPIFSRGSDPAPQPEVMVQTPDTDTQRPEARSGSRLARLGGEGLRADALDHTSPEERVAALAPSAAGLQLIGETLASLGSPADQGLWLRTGLVSETTQGRIELKQGDGSLRVELRPSGTPAGGGSQLSLAAFTTLDLPLTQLVDLRVYAE